MLISVCFIQIMQFLRLDLKTQQIWMGLPLVDKNLDILQSVPIFPTDFVFILIVLPIYDLLLSHCKMQTTHVVKPFSVYSYLVKEAVKIQASLGLRSDSTKEESLPLKLQKKRQFLKQYHRHIKVLKQHLFFQYETLGFVVVSHHMPAFRCNIKAIVKNHEKYKHSANINLLRTFTTQQL